MATSRAPVLTLEARPRGGHYSFDHAEYDEARDQLRLTLGPPTAAIAQPTPEGDVVRIAAPDAYLCGLVVNGLRRRLERDGAVEVVIGPNERVSIGEADVALALGVQGVRRTGRFDRRERPAGVTAA